MINPEKGTKFQEQVRRIQEKYGRGQDRVDSVSEPITLTDVIALTNAEIKCLGWSKKKRREHLKETYGKQSRQQLTDEELLGFLHYLKFLQTRC